MLTEHERTMQQIWKIALHILQNVVVGYVITWQRRHRNEVHAG
jgi:hypothetical protein